MFLGIVKYILIFNNGYIILYILYINIFFIVA